MPHTCLLATGLPSEEPPVTSATNDEVALQLRDYRFNNRRPLLDVQQIKDEHLRALLGNPKLASHFDLPANLNDAVSRFFAEATPRFIAAMFLLLFGLRVFLAQGASPIGWADVAVTGLVAAFWMVQEWVLHDKALHSDRDWFGKDIHAFHHDLPYYHISVDGLGLAVPWFGVAAAAAFLLFPTLALAVTATLAYTTCGLVYEFSHFISHTRVALPGALNGLRQHHMNHHLVSTESWLAFTFPKIDRLFGTLPEDPRGVPDSQRNHHFRDRQRLPEL